MKPKILVIDDSADSWALLNAVLQSHGYAPVWAADGMQAMGVARTHQPQVILLDLGLPGGDGFLILERLKANKFLSHVPVIVITARAPKEGEEKALKLGAVSYVQKPINVDELIAGLQQLLAPAKKRSSIG
ncbi:MAG: response regulator [Nitrospira sp.]|nr:response regulator [Nitrospira sp.]